MTTQVIRVEMSSLEKLMLHPLVSRSPYSGHRSLERARQSSGRFSQLTQGGLPTAASARGWKNRKIWLRRRLARIFWLKLSRPDRVFHSWAQWGQPSAPSRTSDSSSSG